MSDDTDDRIFMQQWPRHKFYYDAPELKLESVFQALPMLCRYRGNIKEFYSVAQHGVLMAFEAMVVEGSPLFALMCLHHDDTEIITGDFPTPEKRRYPDLFKPLDETYQQLVWDMLGIEQRHIDWWWPEVKRYDDLIKYNEGWRLQDPVDNWPDRFAPGLKTMVDWGNTWGCWDVAFARERFIGMHADLMDQCLANDLVRRR